MTTPLRRATIERRTLKENEGWDGEEGCWRSLPAIIACCCNAPGRGSAQHLAPRKGPVFLRNHELEPQAGGTKWPSFPSLRKGSCSRTSLSSGTSSARGASTLRY